VASPAFRRYGSGVSDGRRGNKDRNSLRGVSSGVGRLVARPTRAVAGDVLEPVAEAAVDRALAGPLPEAVARSLVEHHVIERVVREIMARADLEATVTAALEGDSAERLARKVLESPRTEALLGEAIDSKVTAQLAERVVKSPEFEHMLASVMSSPAVRSAIARQTETIGDEMVASLRGATTELDTKLERAPRRLFRRPARAPAAEDRPSAPYGGFASRGIGLGIDVLLVHLVFLVGAAMVVLFASLAGGIHPRWLAETLATVGWGAVQIAYFVGGWSTAGRTPGMHIMGVHVHGPGGRPPGVLRSFVRLVGLWLAIALAFLGFLPALVDDRRRALQDFLAGTEVVYDEHALARLASARQAEEAYET
jgi:uncharacterized RDD family membrane protein YckC